MKISRRALKRLLKKMQLPRKGVQYVLNEFDKNTPSRVPTGKHLCVVDQIASRKMEFTQNSEARATELPFLLSCEFRMDVQLVFSQPTEIKIQYTNRNGKRVTCLIRLDFLIVTNNGVTLVECKKAKSCEKLIKEEPNRFTKSTAGYHYPPAETAAKEMGIDVLISTDRDFTPEFTRNCCFLLNFIDELYHHDTVVSGNICARIAQQGNRIKLSELNQAFGQLRVLQAIYHQQIYVNIDRVLFINPDLVWVYADRCYQEAVRRLETEHQLVPIAGVEQLLDIQTLWWDAAPLEVVHATIHPAASVKLRRDNGNLVALTEVDILTLIDKQELYVQVSNTNNAIHTTLCSKKPSQIEEASRALAMVNGTECPTVSERTLYRLKAKIRKAQDPFLAVLSKKEQRGNSKPRLSAPVLALMESHFQDLLKPSPPPRYHAWKSFRDACESQSLVHCSYEAFNRRFNKIDKYTRTLKQKGFKAAYSLGPRPREIDLNWDLPYHGDYIFEVAHIDHTPVELTLQSALTGEPLEDTLNLSVMYDGHSRKILAVHISFEKPSYRASMMLLRECYRRFNRLPIFIAVDHGPDFQSYYFDSTLADLGIHKRSRPCSASRHGSCIERNFGTTETELIHHLLGNRQLQKLGRGQSTTHKSEKFAAITPDQFEAKLKDYAYLTSAHINRRGISETPQNRWDRSKANFDELPGTKVASEAQFYLATLNDVDRGGTRTLNKNQLEFRGCNYLLHKKVQGYSGGRQKVEVRYDPYDIGHIWICLNDQWVKLTTKDVLVRECLDKGIRLAHMEVYSRRLRNTRRRRNPNPLAVIASASVHDREVHAFNLAQTSIGIADPNNQDPLIPAKKFEINLSDIPQLNTTMTEELLHE